MQVQNKDMQVQISDIQDQNKDMQVQISDIQETLGILSSKFNTYEPIFDKVGLTYELVVRREVREQRGVPFSRAFRVENLTGLARISAPKDIDNNFMAVKDWDTHIILSERTLQLVEMSTRFIPRMRAIVESSAINQKKKTYLSQHLTSYHSLNSESERKKFLEFDVLGLMAFSSGAFNDDQSFEDTLECDVRGEVQVRGNSVLLTVGEIKSGKDRKKAILSV
jgi:hypothetical protein